MQRANATEKRIKGSSMQNDKERERWRERGRETETETERREAHTQANRHGLG